MSTEAVLDDYLEQLLGDAVPAVVDAPVADAPAVDATLADVATMDTSAVDAACDPAGPVPVTTDAPAILDAAPADARREPTWDDLPDEVIYETGAAVSAVLANADSPSLAAAFDAAASPAPLLSGASAAPAPMDRQTLGSLRLPPRTAVASPAASPAPASTWQELQEQARRPDDVSPHRRSNERTSRWLRLRCGGQAYALELLKVQEVVLPVPLLPLRGTAPAMLGIMNLRGQVVPVLDLGVHLGGASATEDAQTRIVVLEENGEIMGLRVSAVDDVTNLSDSQIEPPDTARICRISNDIFRGVARLQQQPMILLDATRLLG